MSKRRSIHFARKAATSFKNTLLDRNGIVRELRAQGWHQIGRGAFAKVLMHPDHPDVVLKVGQTYSSNHWCRQRGLRDGFDRYVDFLSSTRSKLALKVYGDLIWAGDTYIVAIERLYPLNGNKNASKAVTGASYKAKYGSEAWHRVKAAPHAVRFFDRLQWHGMLDVHPKNIMQRLDGTVVVSDPLAIEGASYA